MDAEPAADRCKSWVSHESSKNRVEKERVSCPALWVASNKMFTLVILHGNKTQHSITCVHGDSCTEFFEKTPGYFDQNSTFRISYTALIIRNLKKKQQERNVWQDEIWLFQLSRANCLGISPLPSAFVSNDLPFIQETLPILVIALMKENTGLSLPESHFHDQKEEESTFIGPNLAGCIPKPEQLN